MTDLLEQRVVGEQPCSSTQRSSAASSCRCAAGKISAVTATSACRACSGGAFGANLGDRLLDRNTEAGLRLPDRLFDHRVQRHS
jgi:hypothetical protein